MYSLDIARVFSADFAAELRFVIRFAVGASMRRPWANN